MTMEDRTMEGTMDENMLDEDDGIDMTKGDLEDQLDAALDADDGDTEGLAMALDSAEAPLEDDEDEVNDEGDEEADDGGFGGKKVDRGLRTTKITKIIGCSLLKLLVEQQQLIINDEVTIEELKRFSKKGNSYEAEPGYHDDTVMVLVLYAWLTNQMYFKELTDINTLAMLRDKSEKQIEDDLLPFGFIDDGGTDTQDTVVQTVDWGVF